MKCELSDLHDVLKEILRILKRLDKKLTEQGQLAEQSKLLGEATSSLKEVVQSNTTPEETEE